jgi:hypothetical protein
LHQIGVFHPYDSYLTWDSDSEQVKSEKIVFRAGNNSDTDAGLLLPEAGGPVSGGG